MIELMVPTKSYKLYMSNVIYLCFISGNDLFRHKGSPTLKKSYVPGWTKSIILFHGRVNV